MKIIISILACAMLSGAPIARVKLVDAGQPLAYDGSDYVGPYTLELNGRDVPVLCIDFTDGGQEGDEWNAFASELAGSLNDTYHPGWLTEYEEEAYLYSLIVQPGADRIDLQHAAWSITDSDYKADAGAKLWMLQAQQNYEKIDPQNFVILSQVPGSKGYRVQEFLTESAIPEPPLLNLAAGLAAIGLAVLGRKRA